ncbi:MAG: [NiFe]-hydrogenase assembly chaperone HybE [Alphaproteobacteria bacterium]
MDEDTVARMDALAAAYRTVDERMRGLPVHNPALSVEVAASRPWRDSLLAVLITPWCMNLIRLPARPGEEGAAAAGTEREFDLPCGRSKFLAGDPALSEPHWACSLFSPVPDFPDQATARAVAERIMDDLFAPARDAEGQGGRKLTRRELMRGGAPG